MLEVIDAEVHAGSFPFVAVPSLGVARGESVAVIGASGAGKSLLFAGIMGLAPMTGSVLVAGRPIDRCSGYQRARAGVALVPQDRLGLEHFTVAEVLRVAYRGRRRPRPGADRPDRPDRPDRTDRPDSADSPDRLDSADSPDRSAGLDEFAGREAPAATATAAAPRRAPSAAVTSGDGRRAGSGGWSRRALFAALPGLDRVMDEELGSLGAWERLAVALAYALRTGPLVVLLDEPAAGLPDGAMDRLRTSLQRLNAGGTGLLIATRDGRHGASLAHRAHVLRSGQLGPSQPGGLAR